MTLKSYLTLLRPIRTLLLTAFYGWCIGFTLFGTVGGAPKAEVPVLILVIAGPVMLGFLLTGPLHEVLHRNFAALLPAIGPQLRRYHLATITIVTVLIAVGAHFLPLTLPLPATVGLVLVFLSLPLLNRRRTDASWAKIFGLFALAALGAVPTTRELILGLGRDAPWGLLAGGLAIAALCFHFGFAEDSVRERMRRNQPFLCFQSIAPIPGSGYSAMVRYNAQQIGQRQQAKKQKEHAFNWPPKHGEARPLGDWVNIHHFAYFAGQSFLRTAISLLLATLCAGTIATAVLTMMINRLEPKDPISFAAICSDLATAAHAGTTASAPTPFIFYGFLALMMGALPVAYGFRFASVVLPLPLARDRSALCVFLALLRITVATTVILSGELVVAVLVASAVSHQDLGWGLLARPAALACTTSALGLVCLASFFLVARRRWMLWCAAGLPLLGFGMIGGIGAGMVRDGRLSPPLLLLDQVITPLGLMTTLGAVLLAAGLCWWAIRRHFRRCDLGRPLLWSN